jgi:hypothetical protein
VHSKQRKRDVRFGVWNVRSLYSAGLLTAAARELARYKLDLVGVQEVRWDKGGTVSARDFNFLYGYLGDPDVDGRIILRWIFRKWNGSVEWIGLAQDRARWRVLVNWVLDFWVP